MTKNVTILDEQGNNHGATYPKRAKGLVKSGRARFLDESTICLACPPKENLEDKKMEEILSRIDKVVEDSDYIREAIEAVKNLDSEKTESLEAITAIVQSREATNQQTLKLLEKMYEDGKPPKAEDEVTKFERLTESLRGYSDNLASDILKNAAQGLFTK